MRFIKTTNFDFLKARTICFALSSALAVATVLSLVIKGPNFGIDFTGGSLVQGFFKQSVPLQDVRRAVSGAGLGNPDLQTIPDNNAIIIRFKEGGGDKDTLGTQVTEALGKTFPENPFTVERVEFVGP